MPEAATATAPVAPPATTTSPASNSPQGQPAAPSSASPTSPPATERSTAPVDDMAEIYADLEKITVEETPKPAKRETRQETPKKPDTTAAPKTEEQKPARAADLRQHYDRLKIEHEQLKAKHAELETRLKTPVDDPEKKSLSERLANESKARQALEEEIRYTNYERSSEYKEQYWKPFEEAFTAGRQKVASLNVNDDQGNLRKGTPEDFDEYMGIADDDAAAEYAEARFGKLKDLMLWHRQKVQDLNNRRVGAINDYRTKGAERDKARQGQAQQMAEAVSKLWNESNQSAIDKFPQLFKAEDTDDKGKELLQKGFDMSDRAFSNGSPIKEGQKPMNMQQLIKLRSAVRNKAAAFDYQVYKLRNAEARIKELESELESFRKSEPGPGDGSGAAPAVESWESEMDKIAV